jgi:hypothetical protein
VLADGVAAFPLPIGAMPSVPTARKGKPINDISTQPVLLRPIRRIGSVSLFLYGRGLLPDIPVPTRISTKLGPPPRHWLISIPCSSSWFHDCDSPVVDDLSEFKM